VKYWVSVGQLNKVNLEPLAVMRDDWHDLTVERRHFPLPDGFRQYRRYKKVAKPK